MTSWEPPQRPFLQTVNKQQTSRLALSQCLIEPCIRGIFVILPSPWQSIKNINNLTSLESVRKYWRKWETNQTFEKSVDLREGSTPFVFYEGPPSANGLPGIHHVISRTLKDLVCRYKTMQGFQVKRKGGWDTHGLPVELGVEKMLGITKEDIGKTISVAEYNETCRREVLKYKDKWDDLTRKWVIGSTLKTPISPLRISISKPSGGSWLNCIKKGLLYESVSIQPYSPAAGTGLSSHELNQPGCYKDVKDTTVVAMFKARRESRSEFLFHLPKAGTSPPGIPLYTSWPGPPHPGPSPPTSV